MLSFYFFRAHFSDHILSDIHFVSLLYMIFNCRTLSSSYIHLFMLEHSHRCTVKQRVLNVPTVNPTLRVYQTLPGVIFRKQVSTLTSFEILHDSQSYTEGEPCHITCNDLKTRLFHPVQGCSSWLVLSASYVNVLICICSYAICTFYHA